MNSPPYSSSYPHTPIYKSHKHRIEERRASRPEVDPLDFFSMLPEEIHLFILSFLEVPDLCNSYLVSFTWQRLCEDEFIFRNICFKNYPCLKDMSKPPFEKTWQKFYEQKKKSFGVLGGPIAQAACMDDICSKLRSAGLPIVESYFTQKRIPMVDELHKYSAVLVYSYNSSAFMDGQLMGDILAEYIDNGGGVVVTVFTNCNNLRNGFLKGRFYEQGYHPINPTRQHDTNGKKSLTLGKIIDPTHPILEGVKSLDGGRSSFFCPGSLHPDAHLIAEWSNGTPLVAELKKGKGRVVVLNFFPPSSDTGDPRFWVSSTNGDILLANALAYVGRSSVLRKARLAWQQQIACSPSEDLKIMQEGATREFCYSKDEKSKRERKHRMLGKKLLSKLFPSLRKLPNEP